MSEKRSNKSFFIISFIPALAYWYLETRYPIHIAVTGGITLAILEILFEKLYFKHVHTIAKFNFGLIIVLGGLSLLGEDGLWFRLQPMISGIVIGIIFYVKDDLMFELMESIKPDNLPPKEIVITMQKHVAIYTFIYGLFMGYVALKLTTDQWIFFKTAGFYIAFIIFFGIETIFMRKKIKNELIQLINKDNSVTRNP